MDITNGLHRAKSFPLSTCNQDTIKLNKNGSSVGNDDDDDGEEEDFILLQMPLVPKKFIVKQEIKEEEEDDIKLEYLYPEEEDEIIEEQEEYESVELGVNDVRPPDREHCHQEEPEESSKQENEKRKAELEQKIKDIKAYYSIITSMCNKLDVFIKSVDERLANKEQLDVSNKKVIGKSTELANSKCRGWTHVFGAPYFKDKHFFAAPKNYDVLQKELRHEINVNSLPVTHLWKPYEKQKMAQAIKNIEVQRRVDLCKKRMKDLAADLHVVDNERRLEIEDELIDLKDRQRLIEQLSLAELVHGSNTEYDWLKISVTDLCSQHSPEACRSMWLAYLHPDLNKDEWTSEEKEVLKDLVAKNNFQNWSAIAEQLGTGRSAFQCIRFYQMNLNEQLIRKNWTTDEDHLLKQMVERYRVGTFIPWARVAANIEGRTKVQVFNRWKYCLEPSIKKGRFTEEEDLMILAAMRWYGKNFQQISRFIPGRTPVQLRDRYNASLESNYDYVWDTSCDEKLVEMVEEFGPSAWAFISKSFPGFSRVQLRHRYFVIEKWRDIHGDEFPPIRKHSTKRQYSQKLEDVLGSYINITEERAAILGDKPLFQIQSRLGLRQKKTRGRRPRFRTKRKKYITALDTLFLKHFSVSYHCHRSTSKRVNKEVIEDDGKLLKSLLTIFNAVLNIPDENEIKRHYVLRNREDECLLEYLRNGTISSKRVHRQGDASERAESIEEIENDQETMTDNELAVTDLEAAMTDNESVMSEQDGDMTDCELVMSDTETNATDVLTALLPKKKCNFSLAEYVKGLKNSDLSLDVGINNCSSQKQVMAEPVQGSTASPKSCKYTKGSAANSLSAMLPRKCSYSLAESFLGNAKQPKSNVSSVAKVPLQNRSEVSPFPSYSSCAVSRFKKSAEPTLAKSNVSSIAKVALQNRSEVSSLPSYSSCAVSSFKKLAEPTLAKKPLSRVYQFDSNADIELITGDASVPIDNGITIRWCLLPNYATLICCKTLLLCNAPLSRTVDKSKKREKAEKLRQEDKACTKQTLENIIKSDDPLALQELLTEFDVDTSENISSGKSSFTFAEADALCKQRFVSVLLFPALASIRNVKIYDDVFEMSSEKRWSKSQTEEDADLENAPFFRSGSSLTEKCFKNFRSNTLRENVSKTNAFDESTITPTESGNVLEIVQPKKRGRKRKFESVHIEESCKMVPQTVVLPRKKYKKRLSEPTRKSERSPKPVLRLAHLLYS